MGFWALVLTALVSCIGDLCDGREVLFGVVRGEVRLKPTVNQPISSITWKSGLNKAAEWETGQSTPDYYTICNSGSRCQLDHTTGVLKIMHLKPNEKLDLSAEINGMAAQSFFTVIALEPESKPSVRKTCENTQCTLFCEGKNTTYTKYSWKENNKTIVGNTTMLHVQKSDNLDKSYTCVFSNPVSTEESDPVKEVDLFPGDSSGGIIAGVIALCVAAVGCGIGILYYKKKGIPCRAVKQEEGPSPAVPLTTKDPENTEGNHLMAGNHQDNQSSEDNHKGENAVKGTS